MLANSFMQWRLNLFEQSLGILDRWAARSRNRIVMAPHLATGLRGEDAAYFHLRRLGYVIVARRWRSARQPGDIDLIGWNGEWLCFIEVKTRTRRDDMTAESAVDEDKRRMLRRMAREYLRNYDDREKIPVRFDVVSVYLIGEKPEFDVFPGAFTVEMSGRRS